MPRSRKQPQASLYETDLTESQPELEKALEARESMKAKRSEAQHNFEVADERAQELIAALELGDGAAVRVGRFVVSESMTEGHVVETFEVAPSRRVRIKPLPE